MFDRLRHGSRRVWLALAVWLLATSAPVQSTAKDGSNAQPSPSSARPLSDRDRAANAAREATGGRVLGVQGGTHPDGQNGDYRVRVLQPDGRVRSLQVDPKSGAVRD